MGTVTGSHIIDAMGAQELNHSSLVCIRAWPRGVERDGEFARRVRNDIRHESDAIKGGQALTMSPNCFAPGFVFLLGRARGQAGTRRCCRWPAI